MWIVSEGSSDGEVGLRTSRVSRSFHFRQMRWLSGCRMLVGSSHRIDRLGSRSNLGHSSVTGWGYGRHR
jgi:hypothetical protein